jgi:hypothetical protein
VDDFYLRVAFSTNYWPAVFPNARQSNQTPFKLRFVELPILSVPILTDESVDKLKLLPNNFDLQFKTDVEAEAETVTESKTNNNHKVEEIRSGSIERVFSYNEQNQTRKDIKHKD